MTDENEGPAPAEKKARKARVAKSDKKAKKAKPAKAAKAAKTGDTKSVVDPKYLDRYTTSETKTASGKRKSVDVGDRLAAKLRGLDTKSLIAILKENSIEVPSTLKDRNSGMQRMTVGNMLRARVKRGEKIKVGGETVASL